MFVQGLLKKGTWAGATSITLQLLLPFTPADQGLCTDGRWWPMGKIYFSVLDARISGFQAYPCPVTLGNPLCEPQFPIAAMTGWLDDLWGPCSSEFDQAFRLPWHLLGHCSSATPSRTGVCWAVVHDLTNLGGGDTHSSKTFWWSLHLATPATFSTHFLLLIIKRRAEFQSEKSRDRTNLQSASQVSGGIVPADPMWLEESIVVGLVMANKMYITSRPEHLGDSGNPWELLTMFEKKSALSIWITEWPG